MLNTTKKRKIEPEEERRIKPKIEFDLELDHKRRILLGPLYDLCNFEFDNSTSVDTILKTMNDQIGVQRRDLEERVKNLKKRQLVSNDFGVEQLISTCGLKNYKVDMVEHISILGVCSENYESQRKRLEEIVAQMKNKFLPSNIKNVHVDFCIANHNLKSLDEDDVHILTQNDGFDCIYENKFNDVYSTNKFDIINFDNCGSIFIFNDEFSNTVLRLLNPNGFVVISMSNSEVREQDLDDIALDIFVSKMMKKELNNNIDYSEKLDRIFDGFFKKLELNQGHAYSEPNTNTMFNNLFQVLKPVGFIVYTSHHHIPLFASSKMISLVLQLKDEFRIKK